MMKERGPGGHPNQAFHDIEPGLAHTAATDLSHDRREPDLLGRANAMKAIPHAVDVTIGLTL